mmetsp:Transcript_123391/g.282841  ORF Transcript_123391/g.282841 Transcript_123391/m.282841 type:complete len:172 (-) Transcript_123391:21-536(-)
MCQGGDFNAGTGHLGESIYGQFFRDEKFIYSHSRRGLLSYAHNGEKNRNGSQFFITYAPCKWLDGKHVVFGQLEDGFDVLEEIESVGTIGGRSKRPVTIFDCGEDEDLDLVEMSEAAMDAEPSHWSVAAVRQKDYHKLEGRPELLPVVDDYSPVDERVWIRAGPSQRDRQI